MDPFTNGEWVGQGHRGSLGPRRPWAVVMHGAAVLPTTDFPLGFGGGGKGLGVAAGGAGPGAGAKVSATACPG